MKNTNIFGIKIDKISWSELLEEIKILLKGEKQSFLVTLNPEIALTAQNNSELKEILNRADFVIPDGIGLKFASFLLGVNLHRITGANLTGDILDLASSEGYKVLILKNNEIMLTENELRESLRQKYPKINFETKIISDENNFELSTDAKIMLVAFGAPNQEKFIDKNLKNLPSVKLAIGVGGSFDFIAGKLKRAPKFMQQLGLEWLWRLILEPRYRFKRIIRAVIIFPIKFIVWKFKF